MKSPSETELSIYAKVKVEHQSRSRLAALAKVNQNFSLRPHRAEPLFQWVLLAKLQFFGDGLVTVYVRRVEIIQQPAPLTHHHKQPTPRTVVLLVLLKVLGEVVDTLRQQRNLHVGRTGIPLVELKITNRFRFRFHTFQ